MKKGDILELIDNVTMAAPIGSTARVIECDVDDDWVEVEWIDKGGSGQENGEYMSSRFKVITSIPEKWCIKITKENRDVVKKWFEENGKQWGVTGSLFSIGTFYHNNDVFIGPGRLSIKDGYTEITFEQFKTHILNQETKTVMSKQKLTVSVTDVLRIHSVACSSWKSTISCYLTRIDNTQNITFKQEEVDKMFEAATKEQKPLLEEIFGKQSKDLTLKEMAGKKKLYSEVFSPDAMIEVRGHGEFENKAFWLNGEFNWEIKIDSIKQLCLIPTPKK